MHLYAITMPLKINYLIHSVNRIYVEEILQLCSCRATKGPGADRRPCLRWEKAVAHFRQHGFRDRPRSRSMLRNPLLSREEPTRGNQGCAPLPCLEQRANSGGQPLTARYLSPAPGPWVCAEPGSGGWVTDLAFVRRLFATGRTAVPVPPVFSAGARKRPPAGRAFPGSVVRSGHARARSTSLLRAYGSATGTISRKTQALFAIGCAF